MSAVIKNPGQLRMMCYKAEIVLSVEAWYFLHGTTNGAATFSISSPCCRRCRRQMSNSASGQTYSIKAGQADGSLLGLSREWRIGRKAVRRLLDDFAERGMIAVESNPLTSLISLVCVRSWLDGGRLVENPMFRSAVGKLRVCAYTSIMASISERCGGVHNEAAIRLAEKAEQRLLRIAARWRLCPY